MTGEMVPFAPLPRYTTYIGPGTYATAPVDLSAYEGAVLSFGRGPLVAAGTVFGFTTYFEVSHDALVWTADISEDVPDETTALVVPLLKRWFRVRTVLETDDPAGLVAITLWATGSLKKRVP